MTDYNVISAFFDEYIEHYKELLSFENEKTTLLAVNDIRKLNESLSREQALVMKGNSLESKRIALMKNQGLEGLRFSEIIEKAPEEYKKVLAEKHRKLSRYINDVKRINENAMFVVNQKLSDIEKRLKPEENTTYDEHGEKSNLIPKSGSSLSKNI